MSRIDNTCFVAAAAPTEGVNTVRTSFFGAWIAVKHYVVDVSAAPKAQTTDLISKTFPGTFTYQTTGTYDDWTCEKLGSASV